MKILGIITFLATGCVDTSSTEEHPQRPLAPEEERIESAETNLKLFELMGGEKTELGKKLKEEEKKKKEKKQ